MPTLSEKNYANQNEDYLVSKRQAWFAFAMTFSLMLLDHIDRQVIVSLFPYIRSEWSLSDKQLGALVSIISIIVALGCIPVSLMADRFSRVKSIVVMATTWSLATVSCMFTTSYSQLFAARAMVGVGETGYGAVGAALISTIFPKRLRGALLGTFLAAASLGSVLGMLLGGAIAAKWGWKAAFGVVGLPGLMLALLYMLVRDYKTVPLTPTPGQDRKSSGRGMFKQIFAMLAGTHTLLWVCVGGAMQLIVVSSVWSWLPSYLNRFQGVLPEAADKQAAMVILVGALGSIFWGGVVDQLGVKDARHKFSALAILCMLTLLILLVAFTGGYSSNGQFKLILLGGFLMANTVGIVSVIVIDVTHPALRSTGSAILALSQNLLGMAVGPFVVGVLSDQFGLQQALVIVPLASCLAAICFIVAGRSYAADVEKIANVKLDPAEKVAGGIQAPRQTTLLARKRHRKFVLANEIPLVAIPEPVGLLAHEGIVEQS